MAEQKMDLYEVDDVMVRIEYEGELVHGSVLSTGAPYSPSKALVEGRKLSDDEKKDVLATRLVVSRAYFPPTQDKPERES